MTTKEFFPVEIQTEFCNQPGEINRKFEKSKYSNQIFYTHNIFLYFRIFYISKTNL